MPAPLTTISPPFDLFKQIDVARDSKNGIWTMSGSTLTSPATPAAALQILYQPPPAYRWTVVAQRLSGSESLILGFTIEQHQAMCALEGWGKKLSGLNLVDGRTGDNNITTVRQPVFRDGQPNTIVLTVRPTRVQCEVNGRMVIDWTGSPQQLSLDHRFWDRNKLGGTLFLGSWDTSYAISKCQVELLPLSEALVSAKPRTAARQGSAPAGWPVPDGWHKLEDAASGFRAAFPAEPVTQPQGGGVQYIAEHEGMAFSAQMSPVNSGGGSDDAALGRLCQETFNTGEHRLLSASPVTKSGNVAKLSAVARDDDGQLYTIEMHLESGRLFTVFVVTSAGHEGKPVVRQFLSAFQVLP